MGQFDSATDAALAQLDFEELSKTPGGEFAEIASDLLKLVGAHGPLSIAGGALSLLQKIRSLAGASYASNLIFVIKAVRDDLADLYTKHASLQERIDSIGTDPRFAEAISALALRAMHTSVKDRLKRFARIVVNGVKEDDLEPESLDDMMRAAVNLKNADIVLLGKVYVSQLTIFRQNVVNPTSWFSQIQHLWTEFVNSGALDASKHLEYRSSFSRLESHGLIQKFREISTAQVGMEHYALLKEGQRFYERLQEIGAER